jgi:hypothetical protein
MKVLGITQGYETFVDDADYESVSRFKWYAKASASKLKSGAVVYTVYAQRGRGTRVQSLHRFLTGAPAGVEIDHLDGNGLNNQRCNLRACDHRHNLANRGVQRNNTSGFKGVTIEAGKWVAKIGSGKSGYRRTALGAFDSPVDAAKAYDLAAIKRWGEFAKTNQSLGLLPDSFV